MEPSAGPGEGDEGEPKPTDRKGPPRQRVESRNVSGGAPGRPPQDNRRKRAIEQRYAGWGDGLERYYCACATQFLPQVFPVASHAGAATIPATVVARRHDSLLLCTFSHHGSHVWPDGELVDDAPATVPTTSEIPGNPGRNRLQQ